MWRRAWILLSCREKALESCPQEDENVHPTRKQFSFPRTFNQATLPTWIFFKHYKVLSWEKSESRNPEMNLDNCLKQSFQLRGSSEETAPVCLCSQETATDHTYWAWLHFNKNFITDSEILIHEIIFWIHAICTYKIVFWLYISTNILRPGSVYPGLALPL